MRQEIDKSTYLEQIPIVELANAEARKKAVERFWIGITELDFINTPDVITQVFSLAQYQVTILSALRPGSNPDGTGRIGKKRYYFDDKGTENLDLGTLENASLLSRLVVALDKPERMDQGITEYTKLSSAIDFRKPETLKALADFITNSGISGAEWMEYKLQSRAEIIEKVFSSITSKQLSERDACALKALETNASLRTYVSPLLERSLNSLKSRFTAMISSWEVSLADNQDPLASGGFDPKLAEAFIPKLTQINLVREFRQSAQTLSLEAPAIAVLEETKNPFAQKLRRHWNKRCMKAVDMLKLGMQQAADAGALPPPSAS